MRSTTGADRERLLANIRALGADVDQLSEIPEELVNYIAKLTPEDLSGSGETFGSSSAWGCCPKGSPMNPRDAVAEFKGTVPTGAGWRLRFWCPAAGKELQSNVLPSSKELKDVRSVWCDDCKIDHPLHVKLES